MLMFNEPPVNHKFCQIGGKPDMSERLVLMWTSEFLDLQSTLSIDKVTISKHLEIYLRG